MIAITNYYSSDRMLESRTSIQNDIPVVEFYKLDKLIETRSFPNNTLQYALDAAENYILGILKIT